MLASTIALIGSKKEYAGIDTFGRGDDLFKVSPGKFQLALAQLLLGSDASLVGNIPAVVQPKPVVLKFGCNYYLREHLDRQYIKLSIETKRPRTGKFITAILGL